MLRINVQSKPNKAIDKKVSACAFRNYGKQPTVNVLVGVPNRKPREENALSQPPRHKKLADVKEPSVYILGSSVDLDVQGVGETPTVGSHLSLKRPQKALDGQIRVMSHVLIAHVHSKKLTMLEGACIIPCGEHNNDVKISLDSPPPPSP